MGQAERNIFGVYGRRTICEVLREINDRAQGDTETEVQLRDLTLETILLSKRLVYVMSRFKDLRDGSWTTRWYDLTTRDDWNTAETVRSKPDYKIGDRTIGVFEETFE